MIKFILRILRYNLPRLHNTLCTVSLATFDVLYTVHCYTKLCSSTSCTVVFPFPVTTSGTRPVTVISGGVRLPTAGLITVQGGGGGVNMR